MILNMLLIPTKWQLKSLRFLLSCLQVIALLQQKDPVLEKGIEYLNTRLNQ